MAALLHCYAAEAQQSVLEEAVISIDYNQTEGHMSRELSGIMCDPLGHAYEFVAPDNVLGTKCVRVGWGGDIGFYLNPWPAEGVYDWEPLDRYLDKLAKNDYKILFTFCFTPKWLWPDDPRADEHFSERFFKYYKRGYTLPPSSYEKYEEMVYQTVKHLLIDKGYNIEFEALNEPNIPMFWGGSMEEFFKAYEHTARAVKRASPKAVIGGPAVANYNRKWLVPFIAYCDEHDVPLDFVSWHHYGPTKEHSLTEQTRSVRAMIDTHLSLGRPKLYLTESSYDWNPDSEVVQTPFHAAYMAQALRDMADGELDQFYYCGELGTLEELNPASQTLAMYNMMNPQRVKATVQAAEDGTGVLATRNDEGVNLLTWNLPDTDGSRPPRESRVTIHVDNLPQGTYHYVRYLVDSRHMPGPMRKVTRKSLLINVPDNMVFNADQVARPPIQFDLETYGVTLVQLQMDIKHSEDLDLSFQVESE